ncbi:HD-GYP domain-containing protein [Silvibacterium acidisoli]|uniref:HD-GYP domain-containing protein n=1 Tax=Acidobacteriaceae bacterium ZG23-2 TaxID=2883246 RepID=UPI00406BF8A6
MTPLNAKPEARRDARWMKLARAHDPILHLHCILVSELCACFSAFLDLPRDQQLGLTRAGLLHDIGKIKVLAAILQKPSPLTPQETQIVQGHAHFGHEMLLEDGETDELLLTTTRDHHERLDGSGYPRKLTAPDISIAVRIVTLCDVFAAMTEPRPYVAAMKWDEALAAMAKKRTRLDLDLLAAFATMMTAINFPKKRFSLFQDSTRRSSS